MDFGAVVFEIQIKTFLQHAWSVATHDLTYKTDEVSWSKERIAYQIKAMLEHAEVSIHEAELLSKCSVLPRQDRTAKAIQRIISVLRVHWPSDLPRDVRRLAETTLEHLELVKLKPGDLEGILTTGRDARAGQHPINLSPFATFLQYLLEQHTAKLIEALTSVEEKRKKVFIPAEVSLPPGIERTSLRNAIFPAVPVP
jgi:hypothetical protein